MKKKLIASLLATTSMLSLMPATNALAASTVSTSGSISLLAANEYVTNGVVHTTVTTDIGDVEVWYFADNSTDYSGELPGSKGYTDVQTNSSQKTNNDGVKTYTVSSVLVAPAGRDVVFRQNFDNSEGMSLTIGGVYIFGIPRSECEYSGIAVKFKMPTTNNFKLVTYKKGRHASDSRTDTTYSLIPMTGVETGNKSAEEAVKVQQAFLNYTANNSTTLQELQNLANSVIDVSNFDVTVTQANKVNATESSSGNISGSISVSSKDGSTNYSSSYKMVISATGQSIDTIYQSLNNYCNNYGASNSSKASDFSSAVKITNSDFSIEVGNWSLTPATDVKEGNLSCSVYIKENGTVKKTIPVNKTISKLPTTTATAKEIVQGIVDNYVATNDSSKDSLLNACKAAVGNNIAVTIPNWNLTPATEVKKGSLVGQISITDGLTSQIVDINKEVSVTEQSIDTIADLYKKHLESMDVNNETVENDVLSGVHITNENIRAEISGWTLTQSTEVTRGKIQGVITITDTSKGESKTVPINLTIDYLNQSVETVAKLYVDAAKKYVASNETTADDLIGMVKITNADISVKSENFKLIPATDESTGKVSTNLIITDGTNTVTQPIQINIGYYSEELSTALAKVQKYLSNFVATNDTKTNQILIDLNTAINNSNIFVSYSNEEDERIEKVNATEDAAGYIRGKLLLADSEGHEVKVPVDLAIAKLSQSIDNAEKKVIAYINSLKGSNDLTDNEILFGIQNLLDSNITVSIKDYKVVPATADNTGNISGSVVLSNGAETREIPINLEIDLQAQNINNVINRINSKLAGMYLKNEDTAKSLELALQDCITGAEGSKITIKVRDKDFNKTLATQEQAGFITGDITVVDNSTNIEYVSYNIPIKQLPQTLENANEKINKVLDLYKANNNSVQNELNDLIQGCITGAEGSTITATINKFDLSPSSNKNSGYLNVEITISDGSNNNIVTKNYEIEKITETVDEAISNLEIALPSFNVTNKTTKEELKDMIKNVVAENIDVELNTFDKTLATNTNEGKIKANVTLKDTLTNATKETNLDLVIKKLHQSIGEAEESVKDKIPNLDVDNNTTADDIKDQIKDVVGDNIDVEIKDFNKKPATDKEDGKITGSIIITDKETGEKSEIPFEVTIDKEQTIEQAKDAINIALPNIKVNNSTTDKDLQVAIQKEVAKNIQIEIKDFNKTLATNKTEGKIKAIAIATDIRTNAKIELPLDFIINKLEQSIGEAEDTIKDKIPNLDVDNNTTADDIKDQIKDVVGDNIDVEIKDFNKKPATDKEDGKITGSIIITDKETGEKIEIPFEVAIPKLPSNSSSSSSGSGGGSSSSGNKDKNNSIEIEEKKNETTYSNEKSVTGQWKNENGKWYFYDSNGNVVTGWVFINGYWYYFDVNGIMQIGWFKDTNNCWYYLNPKAGALLGVRMSGWIQDLDGNWYQLDIKSGVMQTGWYQDTDGKWYYLNNKSDGYKGAMKTGWIYDNSNWYFLNNKSDGYKGSMKTGWYQDRGKWYYSYSNGAMAHDTYINGYYLGSDGAWIK